MSARWVNIKEVFDFYEGDDHCCDNMKCGKKLFWDGKAKVPRVYKATTYHFATDGDNIRKWRHFYCSELCYEADADNRTRQEKKEKELQLAYMSEPKHYGNSIHTVSGGLPSLGKRR